MAGIRCTGVSLLSKPSDLCSHEVEYSIHDRVAVSIASLPGSRHEHQHNQGHYKVHNHQIQKRSQQAGGQLPHETFVFAIKFIDTRFSVNSFNKARSQGKPYIL